MQLCAHTGKIVKIREKSPQLSWLVLPVLAVALVACGKPAPKEIPPHQIVPPADQGEFKSGEAFKLVVEPKANVLREAAAGIEYGWKVEGACDPTIKVGAAGPASAVAQVARSCGPDAITVSVVATRGGLEKTFTHAFKPKPIANLFGVNPVSPQPRPGTWRVLDDFDMSPTSKRTPLGTTLGVWNFDGAKCRFAPGSEKGSIGLHIKLAGAKSACGLFLNLAENDKGEAAAGSVEGAKAFTAVVRAKEREVPFVVEVTEYDSYAAHNQGTTVRSKTYLASPDGWHRHEVRLRSLMKGMDFKSVKQVGVAVDRQMLGSGEATLEFDLVALVNK